MSILGCIAEAGNVASPEIWFTPLAANIKLDGNGLEYRKYDFPVLIQPNSPWEKARSGIAVLGLDANVVWSYPDLPALISAMNVAHFKLAISNGMLYAGGTCGKGVEGISQDSDVNRESVAVARQWHDAGGRVDYIVMDGPFYFGYYYAKDCHYSIDEVAKRAASTVRGIQQYFPNAKIVDAEGPGAVSNDVWLADQIKWFKAFEAASGHRVDAVALDLHWKDLRPANTWQDTARRASKVFAAQGIKVGLIINAENDPKDISDEGWMAANRLHIQEAIAANLNLDFLAINQWHGHLTHNLPESDPLAYSSLVDFALNLEAKGTRAAGDTRY